MNTIVGYKIEPRVITEGCLWWKEVDTYWCIVEMGNFSSYDGYSHSSEHEYEKIMYKSLCLENTKNEFKNYEEVMNLTRTVNNCF